jgi:O-antigen/teichoic acid export membrane protein
VSAGGQRATHRTDATTDAPHEPGGQGPERPVAPRSLVANSTWLLSSRMVGLVFGAALSIYAIRQLSVADWGHYSAIVSLVAIFGIFTEAGVSSLTVREIATHPERAPAVLSLATSAVALSAFVSLVLMVGVSFVLGYATAWPALVALGAGLVATQGLAVPLYAIFNARRAFSYTAVIAGVMVPVAAVVGAPLVALGLGPPALLIGALVGQLTSAIVGHALVRKRLGMSLGLRWPRGPTLRFMRTAAPIAATGGLAIVYQRLDILMLSKLGGAAEVAGYAVPYALLQYSWMVPSAVAAAFFPVLSDTLRRDAERAGYLFFLLVRLFFLAIVPGAIFLAVASKPILTIVFGDKYAESAGTLAILAAVVVLAAQNYVLWYGIFAGGKEGLVVGVQAAGLAVNAALNLALIPAFGAEGAASALVVSELVVTAGQAWIVQRWVFPIPWATIFFRLLLASAVAALAIAVLLPVGRLVAAVVGAAACLLVLVLTGYVPRHEWAPLRDPVRRSIARWRTASAGT